MADVQTANNDQLTPEVEYPVLVLADPRDLLTDRNIREAIVDDDLITSVQQVGVLVPIVAMRTADGELRVRFGERRTLAAIKAERDSVPVMVAGVEGDTKAEERARIITQRAENKYRAGMTGADDVRAVHQLHLLGMKEKDMIAQLPDLGRDVIRAAKKIGPSEAATQAVDEYHLDLIQAAKIVPYADDDARLRELLVNAKNGYYFDMLIRTYEEADKKAAEKTVLMAAMDKRGMRVVEDATYGGGPVVWLDELTDAEGNKLDEKAHAEQCPGHAYVVEYDEFFKDTDGMPVKHPGNLPEKTEREIMWGWSAVCDQADTLHPYEPPATIEAAETEAARVAEKDADRITHRQVVQGNKEWDTAQRTRREWVRTLVQRMTPPAGAMEFLTGELLLAQYAINDGFKDGHPLAADWLGVDTGTLAQSSWDTTPAPRRTALQARGEGVSDKRRTVLLLALVLAANEKALTRLSWRQEKHGQNDGCAQREYLRFIINLGYPACFVERQAAGLTDDEHRATDDQGTEAIKEDHADAA